MTFDLTCLYKTSIGRARWEDLPASQRPALCACLPAGRVEALANLDLLVLLGQAKRTKKKINLNETRNQNKLVFGVELHFIKSEYNFE